jgi:hypothetical protein
MLYPLSYEGGVLSLPEGFFPFRVSTFTTSKVYV